VIAQADGVARLYLAGEELDQPATREQKEFIEGIVATDYDGRTVVELLQNGHDAHDRHRSDGVLEFFLDATEGDHGVLYVANGGEPVQDKDFLSMCRIAMSPKRPDEGIGNKGVGFKSVLQLADSPEVYSRATRESRGFDGYCFRFARPEDFDELAQRIDPNRPGFADELRENVASLKVPVPLDDVPEPVQAFAHCGLVTVVRLRLRSAVALERAGLQLDELISSDVPFHLFLERVERISIRRPSVAGVQEQLPDGAPAKPASPPHVLTRSATPLPAPEDMALDRVTLQDESKFLVLKRTIPEAVMLEVIATSRREGGLSSGWERWKGDGVVNVALALDGPLPEGRLFTFLPMGDAAKAPLYAFVNGPFFARLDRRSLDESVALNNLLLDEVARLCATALAKAGTESFNVPEELLLDLACWRAKALPRLLSALAELGKHLEDLPLVPREGGDGGCIALSATRLWLSKGNRFNAASVAAAGVQNLANSNLNRMRWERLAELARAMRLALLPRDAELADFAEKYAAALVSRAFQPAAWAEFFDDLALEIPDGSVLQGRLILIDERLQLLAASTDKEGGQVVFVGPSPGEDSAPVVSPPEAVLARLAFTSSAIPWVDNRRRRRRGREWLEAQNLVHEYHSVAVLDLVGDVMRATEDEESLSQCLQFAFDLWRTAKRDVSPESLARVRLRLPTVSGWMQARETFFGLGWEGETADSDRLLTRLLERAAESSAALSQIAASILRPPNEVIDQMEDFDELRRFAEGLGTNHGLVPSYLPARSFRLSGQRVARPVAAPDLSIAVPAADQKTWRTVASRWPRQLPSYTGPEYTPDTDVAVLPGQLDWATFDDSTQRLYGELVLRGLDVWPDSALEFRYIRSSDSVRVAWPSFVAAFLATAEWVPQTTPGQRTTVTLMSPASAWWLREAETPDYVCAQPGALRALATPRVLSRLGKVGVRFWDDAASGRGRLDELTHLVRQHALESRGQVTVAVRKAYEAAWRDVVDRRAPAPHVVVVTRQGNLVVVDLDTTTEMVYVGDEAGAARERLLSQSPLLMLPLRDRRLAKQVERVLEADGLSCLRSTAAADVDVTIDGVPAATVPVRSLEDLVGRWASLLVLGVMEYQYRGFPPVTSNQLAVASRDLSRVGVAVGTPIITTVDAHVVDDVRAARSFVLYSDDTPRIVVEGSIEEPPIRLLQASSAALAELVGVPSLADGLRLAFVDLERQTQGEPSLDDIARVLGVRRADVEALASESTTWRSDLSAVVGVLACFDVDLAEELRELHRSFTDRDDLVAWLAKRLSASAIDAERIVRFADVGDLLEVVRALEVDLATANSGLRSLGLPPLHNGEGHARQLAAFVQAHRASLQNAIRDRFVTRYRQGESLNEYLRLLALPGIVPDETWLDVYWDVPEELIEAYLEVWLDKMCPVSDDRVTLDVLPSIDDLREAGRRTIVSVMANARVLVDAWLHRHAGGEGMRPGDMAAITAAMTAAGRLDFGRIMSETVLGWLAEHNQWPQGMPLTTRRADLGLSEDDVSEARTRLESAREQRRRATTYVRYGDKTYSDEATDLRALVDAVRQEVPAEVLGMSIEPLSLSNLPTATDRRRGAGGAGGAGGQWRAPTVPPERTKAIGLAGEILVGEWLRSQFGLPPEDTWMSGYRAEVLSDGKGDDRLGYDFKVVTPNKTWLLEVKSTAEDEPEFPFGESEVIRASELADDEDYIIVFVTHALDPTRRRLYPLPNPLGAGGLRHYRVAGRALRLQFQLSQMIQAQPEGTKSDALDSAEGLPPP
jgi:hypothetical protein